MKRCVVRPRRRARVWHLTELVRRVRWRKPPDIRTLPDWCRPRSVKL